jgi:hypothetical protein
MFDIRPQITALYRQLLTTADFVEGEKVLTLTLHWFAAPNQKPSARVGAAHLLGTPCLYR